MRSNTSLVLLMASGLLAAPVFAQSPSSAGAAQIGKGALPVFQVTVVGRTTPAINYRPRSGDTQVDFAGTPLMGAATGQAKVSGERGYMRIDAKFDKLEPPGKFGREYLTYVLWAVTPEGRATNLGEVQYDDADARVKVTTELQAFGLIVTAEPYYAVTRPSDVVVLENVVRDNTKGKVEQIQARVELIERGAYLMHQDPDQLKVKALEPGAPLDLAQARNAVALARLAGADRYAEGPFAKASSLLSEAETAREKGKKGNEVMMPARQAAQTAEDARLVALRNQQDAFLAQERAQNLDRERASLERERSSLAREREALERARGEEARRAEAEQAAAAEQDRRRQAEQDAVAEQERRRQAEQQAEAREAERIRAEQAALAEAERRRQTELDIQAKEAARQQAEQEARAAQEQRVQAQLAAESSAAARAAAERERADAEAARQASEDARRSAEAARAAAETQAAQAQTAVQQAEQEKAALRARVQEQLSVILETRETARGLVVNLSDVLFDTGSATLKPGAREKLARIAGVLLANPGLNVAVEGHTDSVGSESSNQQLSEGRASSVRDYLVRQGVQPGTVGTAGFGESAPVATNDTPAGRQQNRRVELVVSGSPIGR